MSLPNVAVRGLSSTARIALSSTNRSVLSCSSSCGSLGFYSATRAGLLTPLQHIPCITVAHSHTNAYNKRAGADLWKSIFSVSNAGAKKGRGKRGSQIARRNLNRGQVIGSGDVNMVWPGLNAPVVQGQQVVRRRLLEPDLERQKKLIALRDSMGKSRRLKVPPLERGWSGAKMHGRRIGPPDPIAGERFDNFETIVLEFKTVVVMKTAGRRRSASVFTVTGNRNGVAGFALGKANKPKYAVRLSKNRAAQQLIYVNRHNNHTVVHDFFTQFGNTKIYVKKMHEGYGLVCHRVIRAICQLLGIKDIHAKIEGPTNVQSITKAFFLGLLRQKTLQEFADEKGLHVVELREEQHNFPKVVASPQNRPARSISDIKPNENLDFSLHVYGDRVPLQRKKALPHYMRAAGWERHLMRYQYYRNHHKVRRELMMHYGAVKSFLHDQYPECINDYFYHARNKKKDEDEDDDDY